MTASDPRVGEIQARLDAATPGPWRWDEKYGDGDDTGLALTNDAGAEIVGSYNHHCCSFRDDPTVEDNDAEFIAHSPADVAYLLAELRKAHGLKGPVTVRLAHIDGATPFAYIDPEDGHERFRGGEIQAEAIAAAAKAFIEYGTILPAIKAAAPYIAAKALEDAAEEFYGDLNVSNGPRIRVWLRARATAVRDEG